MLVFDQKYDSGYRSPACLFGALPGIYLFQNNRTSKPWAVTLLLFKYPPGPNVSSSLRYMSMFLSGSESSKSLNVSGHGRFLCPEVNADFGICSKGPKIMAMSAFSFLLFLKGYLFST
jgi:hypothetical protein